MLIYVDSNESKKTSFGVFYKAPIIDGKGIRVSLKLQKQLKSRWCWASIACSIFQYYEDIKMEQSDLVKSLQGELNIDKTQYSERDILSKNVNFKLEEALKKVGCFSHWTFGKPSFERIQFEINHGRPFAVRLEWFKGGAHYILVKGYCLKSKTLFVEDSIHGSTTIEYQEFPNRYQGSGAVWTETYWTKIHKK